MALSILLVSTTLLGYIFVNLTFLDHVFIRKQTGFNLKAVRLFFSLIILCTFLLVPISIYTSATAVSLLVIYVLRVAPLVACRLPAPEKVKFSPSFNYYVKLYISHFVKPTLYLLLLLLMAVLIIYYSARLPQ